jgi:hypothetical protein
MAMNAIADGKAISDDNEMPERAPRQFDPRTRHLIEAPITPTLLRLAAPNVLVMVVQASVGLIETYFVGKLGTDALAGVALVFPALMLMQMMSAGAMGGGISSAIARALGSGRRGDADALALHALAIGVGLGLVFTAAVLAGGPWLYAAMGGRGASLDAALTYSNVVFAGAVLLRLFNSLGNIIRGTGNMAVPAAVNCIGAAVLIPLSPCLIFGWGPFPRLAIANMISACERRSLRRTGCTSKLSTLRSFAMPSHSVVFAEPVRTAIGTFVAEGRAGTLRNFVPGTAAGDTTITLSTHQ